MSWLRWVLLESLPALAVVLFIVNFWLLVWWRRGGSPRPLLSALVCSAILLGVQFAVVTQREHAARVLDAIERGVPRADVASLSTALSRDFVAGPMSRDQFIDLARSRLMDFKVTTIRRMTLDVTDSTSDRFVALASYQCDVAHPDIGSIWVATGWRFTFVRNDGVWQIAEIDLPTVNGTKLRTWQDRGR